MKSLRATEVGAMPEEGNLCIGLSYPILAGNPTTIYRRHVGSDVAAPEGMPPQLWVLACDLLEAMGALYITFEERYIILGVTAPADENSTGLLEATDFLLMVLARFAGTTPQLPSLVERSITLLNPDQTKPVGWTAVRREMLELLGERTQAAFNAAFDSYMIV
jgi:hypothetical protein